MLREGIRPSGALFRYIDLLVAFLYVFLVSIDVYNLMSHCSLGRNCMPFQQYDTHKNTAISFTGLLVLGLNFILFMLASMGVVAAYLGIIALELINGGKGQRELETLYAAFETMQCIPISDDSYLRAGRLGCEFARKGYTLSPVDLLIAQAAIENNLSLMSYDEHFRVIEKHSALNLLK
jgi:predicted nucleic acid-binding protein